LDLSAAPMARGVVPANRVPGVDGLRALAALWVVLFHINALTGAPFSHVAILGLFLRSGSTGVSLFLVISGFVLYLPFADGRSRRFKTKEFFLRRARRLLPAYYAAVFAALGLNLIGGDWPGYEALSGSDAMTQLVTHLLLVQTFFANTFYGLNGAFWSLGLEWQLYLALPLLVWGIGRFGLTRTALAAIACNVGYRLLLQMAIDRGFVVADDVVATAVLPNQLLGRWAEFVFGMVVAEAFRSGRHRFLATRLVWLLPLLAVGGLAAVGNPLSHLVFGALFAVLLLQVVADRPWTRVLSWRPLAALGVMSYSLYLVHQPVLQGLAFALRGAQSLSAVALFVSLALLLPVVIFIAWLLFVTVERRTLTVATNAGPRTTQAPAAARAG
jgi:peptidoglycan/LPS O-acetylase OafA/YrhL